MLLSLDGRRVYFDLAGPQNAPTVCFTHSLNADGGMWVEQMVPLLAAGYRGDGEPPALPDEVWAETTRRYIDAYERLTGTTFERGTYPVQPRLMEHLHVSL